MIDNKKVKKWCIAYLFKQAFTFKKAKKYGYFCRCKGKTDMFLTLQKASKFLGLSHSLIKQYSGNKWKLTEKRILIKVDIKKYAELEL